MSASDHNPAARLYPCGRVSRRKFLYQAGGGFFGVAMGALWAEAGQIRNVEIGPHFAPRVKSVIFLFMCGGVSHIDTFDPKDNKWAGKMIDVIGFGDNRAEMMRPVIPCHRTILHRNRARRQNDETVAGGIESADGIADDRTAGRRRVVG